MSSLRLDLVGLHEETALQACGIAVHCWESQ